MKVVERQRSYVVDPTVGQWWPWLVLALGVAIIAVGGVLFTG